MPKLLHLPFRAVGATVPSVVAVRVALVALMGLGCVAMAPGAADALAAGAAGAPAAPTTRADNHPAPKHPVAPAPTPVAPAPAPRAVGPVETPAGLVPHPDKVMVETVTLAGKRLVAGGLDGLLILSDDNGSSWRQVPLPVSCTLTAIRFTDEHSGWAVGHYGVVLRTVDAGEHWNLVYDGVRAAETILESARLANEADAARDKAVQAAQALATSDPARPFLLIQTVGADTIRLLGAGRLAVESLDGGRHWLAWSDGIDNPNGLQLNGLADRNGFLIAAGAHGILLAGKAEDGLHDLKSPFDGSFFGVLDTGRYGVVVFGQQGHAFASTDPGPDLAPGRDVTWHRIDNPSPTALTAGLLRQDGSVLLGDASGATWRLEGRPDYPRLVPARPQAPFAILSMAEAPDRSVILAGNGGVLRVPPETAP